jgi:hypothetical protein
METLAHEIGTVGRWKKERNAPVLRAAARAFP